MKKLISIFFALIFAASAFAEVQLEPLANQFEAKAIESAKSQKNLDAQLEVLIQASKDSQASSALFFNLANLYAIKKDYKSACLYFEKSLAILPTFYQAKYNLALSQFAQNDFEKSLKTWGEVLSISQKDSQKIFRFLGICHFKLSNFSSALASIENALIFNPEDIELLRLKAVCLQNLSRTKELAIFLEELIKKNPKDAYFWRMKARLNYSQGDFKNAAVDAETLVLLNSATPQDFELLTYAYLNLKMYEKASIYAKNANLPDKVSYEIAKSLSLSGNLDFAQKFLENIDKNTAFYWEVLGIIEKSSGKNFAESFDKSYKLDPTNDYVALELAGYYLNCKKFERAKLMYESAKNHNVVLSKIGLGNVEIAQGNFKKASEIFMSLYKDTKNDNFLDFAKKLETLKDDAK